MFNSRRRKRNQRELLVLGIVLIVGWAYTQVMRINWHWRIVVLVGLLSLLGVVINWLWQRAVQTRRRKFLHGSALALPPAAFEQRVQVVLRECGWTHVDRLGGAGDGGVDLRGEFNGQRWIVQCKRYSGNVPPTHVRDLIGTLYGEGKRQQAERGLFVTTGRVTAATRALAREHAIELWDGAELAAIEADLDVHVNRKRLDGQRRRMVWLVCLVGLFLLVSVLWALMA